MMRLRRKAKGISSVIISDKQNLKRTVRQAVRYCQVYDCQAEWPPEQKAGPGTAYIEFLEQDPSIFTGPVPLQSGERMATLAAMKSLDLGGIPARQLRETLEPYSEEAWQRELLDAARIKRVLVKVPIEKAAQFEAHDGRISVMPEIDPSFFAFGRFGPDFNRCAEKLRYVVRQHNPRHLFANGLDLPALQFCVLPICEEENCVLHLRLGIGGADATDCLRLLQDRPGLRSVVSAEDSLECSVIDRVAKEERILVRLENPDHLGYALDRLGTRFIPFASRAKAPEMLPGSWILEKERIWRALTDVYALMLRLGCTLSSESIERDVERLMYGNLSEWDLKEEEQNESGI